MNYTKDQLYAAIISTPTVLFGFTLSDELEYGAGSIYFLSDNSTNQIYASPNYERELIIGTNVINFQLFNDGGELILCDDIEFELTGDLEKDVASYFTQLETYMQSKAEFSNPI